MACSSATVAGLTEIKAAVQQGQLSSIKSELLPLATGGDASAQHYLAWLYLRGMGGFTKDVKEAELWYRRSAQQGFVDAQYDLGVFLVQAQQGYPEAITWFRLAANQGQRNAMIFLGNLYDSGRGVQEDPAEALKWYKRAADLGSLRASHEVASRYLKGRGTARNEKEAAALFQIQADAGFAPSQLDLAFMLMAGEGVNKDLRKSYFWLLAAKNGFERSSNDSPTLEYNKKTLNDLAKYLTTVLSDIDISKVEKEFAIWVKTYQ